MRVLRVLRMLRPCARQVAPWTALMVALGAVMRNWPHVFSVLGLFGECKCRLMSHEARAAWH